jgi:fatty-acyl-CoA synthase
MFHCNGWMFPWTLSNLAGCSHLMRQVRAPVIFDLVEKYVLRSTVQYRTTSRHEVVMLIAACSGMHDTLRHKIGYITGAPITMTTMLSHPQRFRFNHEMKMWTAGAPPPPSVLRRFADELGVAVVTAYGLTETYGPMSTHIPEPEWTSKCHRHL